MDDIYLDNAATTKPKTEVINKMNEVLRNNFANPSSLYKLGIDSEKVIKQARRKISNHLKIKPKDLIFTGSGTIANNIAIKGAVNRLKKFGNRIITTQIEHKSVLEIFKYLGNKGFDIVYLPVNKQGIINIEQLKDVINDKTIMVSIMAVNNELGSVQPLKEVSQIISDYDNIYFHVDGVQAFGKVSIDLNKLKIDLYSISSHKVHGPKGLGGLYISDNIIIDKILHGSDQERGFYPGTENTAGIAGFSEAVNHLPTKKEIEKMYRLKNTLALKIKNNMNNVIINTPDDDNSCAPHILNVSFADIKGEVLVHSLESQGIYVSTGSACTSKKSSISHVIKALNLPSNYQDGAIRFSLSPYNTRDEIIYTFNKVKDSVKKLRTIMGENQ